MSDGAGNKHRVDNPFDGTTFESFKKFRGDILDKAAGKIAGAYSYADHLMGIDAGGPFGPAIAGGVGGARRQEEFMQRKKGSYALVTGDGNIEDRTLRDVLRGAGNVFPPGPGMLAVPTFQNGRAAWAYLEATFDRVPIHTECSA